MFRALILISICIVLVGGCAKLEQPLPKSALTFPKGRIAIDAVGLEIGVAQLDTGQTKTFQNFWRRLDQQELPLDVRRLLDENGIRVAVMSSHAPAEFTELVGETKIDPKVLNEFETQLHAKGLLRPQRRMVTHQRISNREGEAHDVVTSETHPEANWSVSSDKGKSVGFGQIVSGVVSVTTYPNGDGSVRLVIRPEIHHGQERPRIGVGERSFLLQSSQIVAPLEELKFEINLRSGESLVIAPTPDNSGIGQLLFGSLTSDLEIEAALNRSSNFSSGTDEKNLDDNALQKPKPLNRMMMIRVVQTQMDDLFSKANLGEKLTSSPTH